MFFKHLTPLFFLAAVHAACPTLFVNFPDSPQFTKSFVFNGYFTPDGSLCNTVRLYRSSQTSSSAVPIATGNAVDTVNGAFTFEYTGNPLADGPTSFIVRLGTADGSDISPRSNTFTIDIEADACAFPTTFSIANNAQLTNRKTLIAGTAADEPGCDTLKYTFTSGPRAGETYTTYFSPGQPFSDPYLYYYGVPYLQNGNYQLEVEVSSYQGYRPSTVRTINFSVIGGGRCPTPTLSAPPSGTTFYDPANPFVTGSVSAARPDCDIVRYTMYDSTGGSSSSYVQATVTEGSPDPMFSIGLNKQPFGDFTVELYTAVDYTNTLDSSNTIEYAYTTAESRCEPPVITSPQDYQYLRSQKPTFTGTQTNPAACPFVQLLLNVGIPNPGPIPVGANGLWTYTPPEDLAVSQYFINSQTVNAAGEVLSNPSSYVYFFIAPRCDYPSVVSYATTVTGSNLHIEFQGNTNDPDCTKFTFYNNGQLFGVGQPTADPTIYSLDKTNLPNGAYSISVTLGEGALVSDPSPQPYDFVIGNQPSVSRNEIRLTIGSIASQT